MRRTTETAAPLYLGVLALNAALYSDPGIAREAGLIELYLIPASLSVLSSSTSTGARSNRASPTAPAWVP